MHDHHAPQRKHVGCILRLCLAGCLAMLVGLSAAGVEIDGVQITLHSRKYYAKWDMTRLVYRVKASSVDEGDYWILEAEDCLLADHVDEEASSAFEWIDGILRGWRFERTSKNQKFYIWLNGTWELGLVEASVGNGEETGPSAMGEVEGPSCGGTGLSIEVVSGGAIRLPDLPGAGRHEAEETTRLLIGAITAGWALSYDLEFELPPGASDEIVRKIFDMTILPYAAGAATTEVDVAYAVDLGEDDLIGLPEGEYAITIRFTVTTD